MLNVKFIHALCFNCALARLTAWLPFSRSFVHENPLIHLDPSHLVDVPVCVFVCVVIDIHMCAHTFVTEKKGK